MCSMTSNIDNCRGRFECCQWCVSVVIGCRRASCTLTMLTDGFCSSVVAGERRDLLVCVAANGVALVMVESSRGAEAGRVVLVKLSDRRGDTRANPVAGANLLPGSLFLDTTDEWWPNCFMLEWCDGRVVASHRHWACVGCLSQVRALGRAHKTWATGKRLVIVGRYPV